ncbi:MAG TPA: M1 family aminopeptidase [Chloroflexota bacterium]|nr:M1 family aminopeptidase [Chloroflexota bacterium]
MNDAEFRLPRYVRPERYAVHLAPDLETWSFTGEESILLTLDRDVRRVELHALDLDITRAEAAVGRRRLPASVTYQPGRETAELRFAEPLPAGRATLRLEFRGTIGTGLRGLYRAEAGGRRYAFTQFEATDARRAFPCFDEPAFKARFDLSATVPADLVAISNGAPLREAPGAEPGTKTVTFATTPRMSTYLVALAVGALEPTATALARGGTPIRVWTVPGKTGMGGLALEAAVASLNRLERYFGVRYPYGKLDLLAVPDFEAGAMENSGAIFFRETALLCDPATASVAAQKRIALVVAHEIAHQWFGNLVTMQWWDDLWLNEAFATWIEFRTVGDWRPDWDIWVDFQQEKAAPFATDALASTRPIHAPVKSAAQASEMFDAITYEKGAAVLFMLEQYVGPQVFRAGVRQYIRDHREGNATANDLFAALEQASGTRVRAIARDWIEQPGFPLVRATARPAGTRPHLLLEQQRFFANPNLSAESTVLSAASEGNGAQHSALSAQRAIWRVPIVLRYADGRRPLVQRALLSTPRAELALETPRPPRWLYANAGGSGFYRVLHDPATLSGLTNDVGTVLDAAERVALIGNQWALARADYAGVDSFLSLLEGFRHEPHHAVVESIVDALASIDYYLVEPDDRPAWSALVEYLLAPQIEELGWQPAPGDDDGRRLRRAATLRALGRLARLPAVVGEARQGVERYWADANSVDPNLVDVFIAVAAQDGSPALFDQYLAHMREARTPQDETRHLFGLATFEDPVLVQQALDLSLTPAVKTQDVGPLLARLLGNPVGKHQAWNFIRVQWPAVEERLPPFMRRRLVAATVNLATAEARDEVAAFFAEHPVEGAERTLRQTLEQLDIVIGFRERAAPRLRDVLRKDYHQAMPGAGR